MKSYKIISIVILLFVILFIQGSCAARKSILQTPLRFGEELSGDSIRFRNLSIKAVSDAILKVKGEQWPLTRYDVNVKLGTSENSYRVDIFEFTQYYEAAYTSPSTEYMRRVIYDIILKAGGDGSIIMKIQNGRITVIAKGQPFKPNTTYRFFQSQRPGDVSGRFIKTPPVISEEEKQQFIRQSTPPFQTTEMKEKQNYYLKDFALLVEKYLPK